MISLLSEDWLGLFTEYFTEVTGISENISLSSLRKRKNEGYAKVDNDAIRHLDMAPCCSVDSVNGSRSFNHFARRHQKGKYYTPVHTVSGTTPDLL